MPSGPELGSIKEVVEVGDFTRHLPDFVSERIVSEVPVLRSRLLKLLSCEPTPPSASQLGFALRCLRSYERQDYPLDATTRVSITLALWQLLKRSERWCYHDRSRIVDSLRRWLRKVNEDDVRKEWIASSEPDDGAAEVRRLSVELDLRIPIALLLAELRCSLRSDKGAPDLSHHRPYASHLASLIFSMQKFMNVSTGLELAKELSDRLDSEHCYGIFFARMLAALSPSHCVPQLVLSGHLWQWWSTLPEGLVPKFDLMWFGLLARYAKLRWLGGVPGALAETTKLVASGVAGPGMAIAEGAGEADCDAEVRKQWPWLFNKVCRTLSLPSFSPAFEASETRSQNPPDMDRYHIPEEIDAVIMGSTSTWKRVAKFIVYSLEAKPPPESSDPSSSMWAMLTLLVRRMHLFMRPANAGGDWVWHCTTLNYYLVLAYNKRVCRERLIACAAPFKVRLTKEADDTFISLILPMVNDSLAGKRGYETITNLENLNALSRLAAMQAPSVTPGEEAAINPFSADVHTMLMRATETLGDPSQSDRHVALLQMCSSSFPAIILRWPEAIGGLFTISLWGIDATDIGKTLSSLQLLVSAFCQVPCLDTNDWPSSGPEAPAAAQKEWRWPQPAGIDLRRQEGSPAIAMIAAMMPNFATDLFEKIFEYLSKMPKPAGKESDKMGLESSLNSMIHVAAYLVATQCDNTTYSRICEATLEFIERNLLVDQVKTMRVVVTAVARANPEVAIPILLPPLLKKLFPRQKTGAADAAVTPLHEGGGSESEVFWLLSALTSIVRHAGPVLLGFRKELERLILGALMDERDKICKIGSKMLRRVLFTLTSTYIAGDYRLCSSETWRRVMKARRGEGVSKDAWPLKWHGWTPPWWSMEAPSIEWHIPSEGEVSWAKALVYGIMSQFVRLLGVAVPAVAVAHSRQEVGSVPGSEWLNELKLPEKKKAAHSALLALKLACVVFRSTADLWPDERADSKFEDSFLPSSSPFTNDQMGRIIFECFSDPVLTALKDLASQEQFAATSKQDAGGVLDPMEVPKLMKKLMKVAGELLGARQWHVGDARLFPSSNRGHGSDIDSIKGHHVQSVLSKLHPHSALRERPRMRWVLKVADLLDLRREDRLGGHPFTGRRKAILETICSIGLRASFEEVKHRAQQSISHFCGFHIGSRWALTKGTILPALATEVEAVLRSGTLTGEEADREEPRLNKALRGCAGSILLMVGQAWRRGIDDASTMGLSLCEAIYAVTKVPDPSTTALAKDGKKCEVEASTMVALVTATKAWLDSRDVHCEASSSRDKADSRPTGEMEELEAPGSVRSGFAAVEAVQKLLGICERPDCFWRAQVMCTSVILALLNSLRNWAVEETSKESVRPEEAQLIVAAWRRWLQWLLRCCDAKANNLLRHLGVHSLMLILKCPAPLSNKDLKEAGLCEMSFFEKLLAAMPPLRHDSLIQAEPGVQIESVKVAVDTMTDNRWFKLWPRVWLKGPRKDFSLWNTLFWQSYFAFLQRSTGADAIVAILARGAEHLSTQDKAEAEYHAMLAEMAAGALRALRKDGADGTALRRRAWSTLHPWLLSELQKGSQERLEDWINAIRFIVRGTSKPLLKRPLFDASPATQDGCQAFLTPLFNFVLNIEACPGDEALTCAMAPIRYEGDDLKDCLIVEGKEVFKPASRVAEGSSFEVYKRLRLLLALLMEPSAVRWIADNEAFCSHILEALCPGLGHPYKQLREETARMIYFVLRAARVTGTSSGLAKAVSKTQGWLGDEAQRLLLRLREDNSAAGGRDKEAESRPAHVLESSGICYVLLHVALARMSTLLLEEVVPRCIEFLVAAAVHDDFELRGLAIHALQVCSSAHSLGPAAIGDTRWCLLGPVNTISRLLSATDGVQPLSDKELEKALSLAARPAVLGNFFILNHGEKALLTSFQSIAEAALGHSKPEVRTAAKGLFTSMLAIEADTDVLARVKRLKVMAGPVPKGEEPIASSSPTVIAGVVGLSCALLAAVDRGVPTWTGRVVQNIAPYGRKGMSQPVTKEVGAALQAFLKLMQSRHHTWQQCQEKLTASQLDLLDAYKGKLSYFS